MNSADARLKRDRVTSVSLVVFCQSFQVLFTGGIALFLPAVRNDLGLSFTQGGSLAAAASLIYTAMQIPGGYLADRFSTKKLFLIGILGATSLSFIFALTTAYWQIILNQAFTGFFRAFLFAPGMAFLMAWFPRERRATAMSLYLVGLFSGNILFSLAGPVIANRFDWRVAFMVFSAAGIMAALALARFGKEAPTRSTPRKAGLREVAELFRLKVMWLCGGLQYVRLAVMQGVLFWLPSLLISEKGLPLQLAGAIVAMQGLLTAPSNLVGGYVSDRLKNPTLVMSVSLAVLAITTVLLVTAESLALLIAVIAINAIFLQMYFGPLFALPVEILGAEKAGMSSGFSNLFANLGGLTFTYLLGALKDATGSFHAGFYALSGACLVGLVLTAALAKTWKAHDDALIKITR